VDGVSGASGAAGTKEDAMSVITPTIPVPTDSSRSTRSVGSLRRSTVVAGVVAAALCTTVAAAAHAAGVPLAVEGEMIPLAAFAQLTFIGAVVGGVLLAVLNRRSRTPRRRFLETTATLTALSCIPSVLWPPDAATKVTLVALHLLAAAMIVPTLARHAND
jgi:hypothetical protein